MRDVVLRYILNAKEKSSANYKHVLYGNRDGGVWFKSKRGQITLRTALAEMPFALGVKNKIKNGVIKMLDFFCNAMEFLMSIVGYVIAVGFLILLSVMIAHWRMDKRPMPWEKEEAKAAKKAAKEERRARRQFWGD